MKTILVPTDFSESARNAARFAMLLAKKQNAQIILHHSFEVPVAIAEISYDLLREEKESLRKETERRLRSEEIELKHAGIRHYQFSIKEGNPTATILEAAKEKRADIIIMGTQGSNEFSDELFGTHTSQVMERAECPVMAIPVGCRFDKPVKNITYAMDYRESDIDTVAELAEFAGLFHAQITVLHISSDDISPEEEKKLMDDFRKRVSKEISYNNMAFQVMYSENVEDKLHTYLAEERADVLVMSTHKRKFFERLFITSLTKELALNAGIPIIAFHYDRKKTAKLY